MAPFLNGSKTPLQVISLFLLCVAPLAVVSANHLIDTRLQANVSRTIPALSEQTQVCHPQLTQADFDHLNEIDLSSEYVKQGSLRMAEIFAGDQAGRVNPLPVGPRQASEDDLQRRVEVLAYIRENKIQTARDLVYAAFVFQHGDCPRHYLFANKMAELATKTGYEDAKWIYAATLDRYLMSQGQLQKYGTQYTRIGDRFQLYPVDSNTTDEERRRFNVPPLDVARIRTSTIPTSSMRGMQVLESWWLTVVGAGMNVLCIALVLPDWTRNKNWARVNFGIALAIYMLSIVGHYCQVNALMQSSVRYTSQQAFWSVLVILSLAVLLIQAIIAVIRYNRTQEE